MFPLHAVAAVRELSPPWGADRTQNGRRAARKEMAAGWAPRGRRCARSLGRVVGLSSSCGAAVGVDVHNKTLLQRAKGKRRTVCSLPKEGQKFPEGRYQCGTIVSITEVPICSRCPSGPRPGVDASLETNSLETTSGACLMHSALIILWVHIYICNLSEVQYWWAQAVISLVIIVLIGL